jgi:hypothetical protein
MPLTSKLKTWTQPAPTPAQPDAAAPATPVVTAPPAKTEAAAPTVQTAAAPPVPNEGWMNWLAQKGQGFRDWNRAFDNRFSLGGLDYLFSQLPSPAKTQSGLSTEDFLAQERAKTQQARENIGPLGRASADVLGYATGPSKLIPGGPIVQGGVSNAAQAAVEGRPVTDIATSGVEGGLWGGLSIPVGKYVVNPIAKAVAGSGGQSWNPLGSGAPSKIVFPYAKPGDAAPTLGGVPGFRDPNYPANMSAQDLANMARELEAMPKAEGEGGDVQNAMREIMKQRINAVASQGAPEGGQPGSGLNKVNQAYWDAGGPPNAGSPVDNLSPAAQAATKAAGAGIGGAAGHFTGVPGAQGAGAVLGAEYLPKLYATFANPAGGSAYPAFAVRPPSAQQALSNLLIGGGPDVDQYLKQNYWPTPQGQ